MESVKRILITRTDRIGDVLLSTPAIKALRKAFPQSHIAVMVRPYARDIVLGNPYLDEVIIYDKYGAQRSFWKTIKFARDLRARRFDLALVLHPTRRQHLITFLAGIKKRVGFNLKLGFLLTDKLEHKKQEGKRHELEYTLDIVRSLGIKAQDKDLFMPIRKDSEMHIERLLQAENINKMVALHPGASCASKLWPLERFARVADALIERFNVKIVVLSSKDDIARGKRLLSLIHHACIDACGMTTVSELASLLRKCSLLICNDSGPMHIAAALKMPVIAIFGRAQAGLSPRRWGPRGKDNVVLHKDVGCSECLAHNCQKGFACLSAVSVQEVVEAAVRAYSNTPLYIQLTA
ncbi:MAG: lipopolysaccharide heptosyltransferase II [Candidatus Omnitrophota bacterium]|nr:MAG: lipopolysaccharide heptosyltransferase II [Candidatus Omnitrophota bacterium]